tara:strand:+ start:179 stop:400 length:222 start_codon:yes stop_codon:yes gene_type:complete
MKVVALSLCILTGVVDTKNDGVVVVEVVSPHSDEVEYVSMTSDVLPSSVKEGERVSVTTLTDSGLEKYCQPPL